MTRPASTPSPRADAPPASDDTYAEATYGDARARSRVGPAVLIAATFVLTLVAAGLVWTLWPRGQSAPAPAATTSTDAEAGGLASQDADGDGIVYQSGMHPWIVEDEPGQCPICGMDLQPVSVSGAAEGTVEIDPVTMQNIGVRTATVAAQPLDRIVRTTGVFAPSDRARVAVSLKTGGWVERLYVSAEGDRVRAGQPLFELYSPELVATQEELLLALRTRELLGDEGGRLVQAARRRLALFDVTPEQIARLEDTGEVLRTLTVYAPGGGTVTEHQVVEGMQAAAGRTLMQITDLSRLWLQVDVPESDLGWVDVGARASVTVESFPGAPLTGRVGYVYDRLEAATRSGTARIDVPNPGRRIKPGMYATATLFGAPSEALPVVPSEAIIRTGENAVVILALEPGRFAPQPVTLGRESGGLVQILSGLSGGEEIVTSAQFLIDSEARLASAVGAMGRGRAASTDAPDPLGEADHSQMNH